MGQSYVIYAASHFIEGCVAYYYFEKIFGKHNRRETRFYYYLAYFCLFAIMLLKIPVLNMLSFLLINAVIARTLYDSSIRYSIFYSFILTGIMVLTEIIADILLGALPYIRYAEINYSTQVLTSFILSKILFLVIAVTIAIYKNGKNSFGNNKIPVYLVTIMLLAFTIVGILAYVALPLKRATSVENLVLIACILMIFLIILVIWLQDYIQKTQMNLYEAQLINQQEKNSTTFFELVKNQDIDKNIFLHDIKNHLMIIKGYLEKENCKNAKDYLEQLIGLPVLSKSVQLTTSDDLNILLARYVMECEQKGIKFQVDCTSDYVNSLKVSHMTQLFCNLLDNAVEAAVNSEDPFITLMLRSKKEIGFTKISIINSCRTAPKFNKDGMPITKKRDDKKHGFGIKSILRIVKQYGGESEFIYDSETRTFRVVLLIGEEDV